MSRTRHLLFTYMDLRTNQLKTEAARIYSSSRFIIYGKVYMRPHYIVLVVM